jgi:hypothetical protein
VTPDLIYPIYFGIALFFVGCGYLAYWLVRRKPHWVWGQWGVLVAAAVGLLVWGAQETGEYAGVGQAMIVMLLVAPAMGLTAIGAAVGLWLRRR